MTFQNNILHGDCLEIMPKIPSKSIDMVLCDLPYGVTARNDWDKTIPLELLWNQFKRLAKSNAAIILTATQPFASYLILSNSKWFRYDLIWEKNRSTGFLNANKMPLRTHESILVFYRKSPIFNPQKTFGHKPAHFYAKSKDDGTNYGKTATRRNGGGQTDRYPKSILKIPVVNNDSSERIHPTQKPVELFEWLIRSYTNEQMLVLDNCIGSGTTAIACLQSNRNFIGIEKDANYFRLANERINKWLTKESR